MKNHVYILAVIYLCMMSQSASPELLIVKKVGNVFAQLSKEDVVQSGKTISEILLKYQWPMCIMSELDPDEEQTALLSPNKPHAEEIFIENKIKASDSKFKTFRVIFVPTTLYELFCLVHSLKTVNVIPENPFVSTIKEVFKKKSFINLNVKNNGILNEDGTDDQIRKKVYDQYKTANNYFFNQNVNQNAFLYINNAFVEMLFNKYPGINKEPDLTNAIKDRSGVLTSFLIGELWNAAKALDLVRWNDKKKQASVNTNFWLGKELLKEIPDTAYEYSINSIAATLKERETKQKIVSKVIALEYEARELNKALLIRGTVFDEFLLGSENVVLAGNTLWYFNHEKEVFDINTLRDLRDKIQPYSIAFGNSLFAGALFDRGACSYRYLAGIPCEQLEVNPHKDITGYAILIDKEAYYKNQCDNLFFIAPLATIAAISQCGEFFHSRTKAAIEKKGEKFPQIKGISSASWNMTDPTGVILIEGDPLEHAELFSTLLAEGGRMIQLGDVDPNSEYGKAPAAVKKSQLKAAEFYKKLRSGLISEGGKPSIDVTPVTKSKIPPKQKSMFINPPASVTQPEVTQPRFISLADLRLNTALQKLKTGLQELKTSLQQLKQRLSVLQQKLHSLKAKLVK